MCVAETECTVDTAPATEEADYIPVVDEKVYVKSRRRYRHPLRNRLYDALVALLGAFVNWLAVMTCIKQHANVHVREAPGKGWGVFAGRSFRAGEVIEVAPTVEIPADQWIYTENTPLKYYTFSNGRRGELVALGFLMLYNHSNRPNAVMMSDRDGYDVCPSRTMRSVALRCIRKGEELTISYGTKVWFEVIE